MWLTCIFLGTRDVSHLILDLVQCCQTVFIFWRNDYSEMTEQENKESNIEAIRSCLKENEQTGVHFFSLFCSSGRG